MSVLSPARAPAADLAELAEALGEAWGRNRLEAFVALFAPDGDIVHPYFSSPTSPAVAMEVMNAAVQGETRLVDMRVFPGQGADEIVMRFEETGSMIGVSPRHVGLMRVRAKVRAGLVQRMTIEGLEIETRAAGEEIIPRRPATPLSSKEIAERLAATWGGNDMPTFLGLFAPGAVVDHVLLADPATPRVVAEVMNCNVKGATRLSGLALMKGDGSGTHDILDLEFEETGSEIGYAPTLVGRMSVSAEIRDHQIVHLKVLGYKVVDTAAAPALGVA